MIVITNVQCPLKSNVPEIPNPMEKQQKALSTSDTRGIILEQLIDGLVGNSLSVAGNNHSMVVNEIDSGVVLHSATDQLLSLLDHLLFAVISNSRRGKIYINAEKQQQQLVLYITERNNYNGYALSFSIGALADDAASLGGNLEIKNPQKLETTICFCLPEAIAA